MTSSYQTAPGSDKSPVFILGNPRSGTTLFRLVLTAHPKIGIPPESEFIVAAFKRFGSVRCFDASALEALKSDLNGDVVNLGEQWKVDINELFCDSDNFLGKDYAGVCSQLYRQFQIIRGFEQIEIWGDKNNAYGNYVDVLTYLFPSARFIHLVRDGRAVLNSYKKLETNPGHKYAPILPKTAQSVALRWVDTVSRIDRHLSRLAPENHLTVRYEDVLSNFVPEIGRVCKFLGIEYESKMLHFDQLNRRHELEPHEYGWKKNTYKPLDSKKAVSWRTELAMQEMEIFERQAASILCRFDYPLVSNINADQKSNSLAPALIKGRVKEQARSVRLNLVKIRAKLGI